MARLLGMTDEQRLAIEEATGIKTEGVRLLLDAANTQTRQLAEQVIATSIKEVQSVVGLHGSVTRLQAGGVNISQGLGVSVFESGVLKTTIEPDGDFLAGSDITQPSTTSFCVFVNEQVYNNETMGAGDILIGDNSTSTSNVKYDASEGQLQFRQGTTVKVYMDTDGTLVAGSGVVVLSEQGIDINVDAATAALENLITWSNNAETLTAIVGAYDDGSMDVGIETNGAPVLHLYAVTEHSNATIDLAADESGDVTSITHKADTVYFKDEDGATTRVAIGDNVGIGTTTPAEKLDVKGNVAAHTFIHNDSGILMREQNVDGSFV